MDINRACDEIGLLVNLGGRELPSESILPRRPGIRGLNGMGLVLEDEHLGAALTACRLRSLALLAETVKCLMLHRLLVVGCGCAHPVLRNTCSSAFGAELAMHVCM